jgi:hypothetical protein
MGRKPLEKVSQREYARRLNLSNEAVRKAIEAGKISKGWDKKEKKIIVEKANEEWGNLFIKVNEENAAVENEAIKNFQSAFPEKPQGKKFIDPEDTQAGAFGELEQFELAVSSKAQFAEALRVEKIAKARQEIIRLRELTGELANKAEVYKQLFGFGQSVRQAVLAVPDRCIDEILASPTRAEAHIVMTKYLHEALEKLSDVDTMTFKQQENENE